MKPINICTSGGKIPGNPMLKLFVRSVIFGLLRASGTSGAQYGFLPINSSIGKLYIKTENP